MASRVIWKFALDPVGITNVEMPHGALTLSVQAQHDHPVLWAVCDPNARKTMRRFRAVMTGQGFDMATEGLGMYRGTVQMDKGAFVVHVFEE